MTQLKTEHWWRYGIVAVILLPAISCSRSLVEPADGPSQSAALDTEIAVPAVTSEQDSIAPATGTPANGSKMMSMPMPAPEDIVFKEHVDSNAEIPKGLDGLVFMDTDGNRVTLESFLGEKNIVLVFTEGFAGGMLCPFCKTQTSRLVANHEQFKQLDTQVLVVYPGTRDHLDEFVAAATSSNAEVDQVPFPIVLDQDFTATNFFNIRSKLAHPSTYIIDKSGNVRLAYVGADMTADRPSISAMLRVLELANQ